jgi:hypothetical protein
MFLEEQGYEIRENTFYQDNQSAMKLETNGRASCGQKSRHIDIRYFFMKDRIKIEDIKIVYCPTEQMLADFFTKPLQGSLFERFRKVLMGHTHIDTLSPLSLFPTEERVEEKKNTAKTELVAAGKNGPGEQNTNVSEDVTVVPEPGWTVVEGRTRAYKKGSSKATRSVRKFTDERLNGKTKKQNESSAHSVV